LSTSPATGDQARLSTPTAAVDQMWRLRPDHLVRRPEKRSFGRSLVSSRSFVVLLSSP
jgi:hypothetical protein